MKIYKIIMGVVVIILTMMNVVSAQQKPYECYFEVGKPCPDFNFDHLVNWPKKEVSLKDFRSKWLILDFWNKGCSACLKSFPKINEEQKAYKENVQFLLVGYQDKEKEINPLFDQLKKRLGLEIPNAFVDGSFTDKVDELDHGMPFVVIIDPDGVVRGSGPSLELIGLDLNNLRQNSQPQLHDFYRERRNRYKHDSKIPFLVNENGGPDSSFLFRSLLSIWTLNSLPFFYSSLIDQNPKDGRIFHAKGRLEMAPVYPKDLYLMAYTGMNDHVTNDTAYYGKFWPTPFFEIKDTALLNIRYTYSLVVPAEKANKESMMKMMQNDLNNYFGYVAKIETRNMPCWRLVVVNNSVRKKLMTKGGDFQEQETMHGGWYGFTNGKNYPMEEFIYRIKGAADLSATGMPLFDATGIEGNIDIPSFSYIPKNFVSVKKELLKMGLDLVKGESAMKVVVITDPQPTSIQTP